MFLKFLIFSHVHKNMTYTPQWGIIIYILCHSKSTDGSLSHEITYVHSPHPKYCYTHQDDLKYSCLSLLVLRQQTYPSRHSHLVSFLKECRSLGTWREVATTPLYAFSCQSLESRNWLDSAVHRSRCFWSKIMYWYLLKENSIFKRPITLSWADACENVF